jgi:hypothetical protein
MPEESTVALLSQLNPKKSVNDKKAFTPLTFFYGEVYEGASTFTDTY